MFEYFLEENRSIEEITSRVSDERMVQREFGEKENVYHKLHGDYRLRFTNSVRNTETVCN